MQLDGQTDMTKLIFVFRNFAKASKKKKKGKGNYFEATGIMTERVPRT